jgi:hypothetical protein
MSTGPQGIGGPIGPIGPMRVDGLSITVHH